MAILKTVREALFGPDTSDTEYYSYVAQEISSGFIDDGLWTRALAETQYDERKARARYITLRVSVIMREVASESAAHARLAEFRRSLDLAYQQKDYETCLAGWSKLATEGESAAMYSLAYMYARGQGVYKNTYLAYYWATCAVMKGNPDAAALKIELIPQMMSWDIEKAEAEAANSCSGNTALTRRT